MLYFTSLNVYIVYLTVIASYLIAPSESFISPIFNSHLSKRNIIVSASVSQSYMPPADLTPAVDKFVRLPNRYSNDNDNGFLLRAKDPPPKGPEPFSMVSEELQPLSDYVKELVVSENPVLTMAASHFFNQVNSNHFFNIMWHFTHTMFCYDVATRKKI